MLSEWRIRNKLLLGIGLLLVIVATFAWSSLRGVYSYADLVKSLRGRSAELPLASELSQYVSDLRVTATKIRNRAMRSTEEATHADLARRFAGQMEDARETVHSYRQQFAWNEPRSQQTINQGAERETLEKIEATMRRIEAIEADQAWYKQTQQVEEVCSDLETLQDLSFELPGYLHQRMQGLVDDVRGKYHTLIAITWVVTISAVLLLFLFFKLFYAWVFQPLSMLIEGSRRVAAGDFNHRIRLHTHDEISELAGAMNDMTSRFQAIRDDLDRQVQERTKQVVRSEQLASVGFLAAGVAHEINNPLASIALCAESLESRLVECMTPGHVPDEASQGIVRNYLQMIQDEAFRCKGITEKLLDFSRMGDVMFHDTDLRELVQDVIDMVRHLGRYQDKQIELTEGETVIASVNAQQVKQVVLNLITNGLDSLSLGGLLRIDLHRQRGQAELVFEDNGCGMTPEVLQHLFEPFFTRRRTGQGIGLGLSITHRIVEDHGGHMEVFSQGPGQGSRFRVFLPLEGKQKEARHQYQAA